MEINTSANVRSDHTARQTSSTKKLLKHPKTGPSSMPPTIRPSDIYTIHFKTALSSADVDDVVASLTTFAKDHICHHNLPHVLPQSHTAKNAISFGVLCDSTQETTSDIQKAISSVKEEDIQKLFSKQLVSRNTENDDNSLK
ncbi:uncharacterized protein LOC124258680, partial [Haliotis rubra]|uniref:uncharacterized protein LOC124258680 n=1 Tax=Haliotis rubra TaxID=36100 RepID=UPI001EE5464D